MFDIKETGLTLALQAAIMAGLFVPILGVLWAH